MSHGHDEYLTRLEIASILKISGKQAGRLMDRMPTLRVGRSHRRVRRSDFEAWVLAERQASLEPPPSHPREAALKKARLIHGFTSGGSGSVVMAAEALKKRRRLAPKQQVE